MYTCSPVMGRGRYECSGESWEAPVIQVLEGLGLTPDQFVDLCILCGCDYCGTIKGILPSPSVILQGLTFL